LPQAWAWGGKFCSNFWKELSSNKLVIVKRLPRAWAWGGKFCSKILKKLVLIN
jgi:alpha-tubulin suppressor-like RCC1 family protein